MRVAVLWTLIAGFLFGVSLRSFMPLGLAFAGFLALLGIGALIFSLIEGSKRVGIFATVALFACAGGVTRMHMGIITSDPVLDAYVGEKTIITGIVQDEPDVRENNVRITLRAISVASSSIASARVLVMDHTQYRW